MKHEDSSKLIGFIDASKSKGASDEFLASFLSRRGWPQDDVYAALGNYWERVTGLSVPERSGGGESSRDAFLYLLSFSTLATWTTALGSMLFRFIEHWFPDPVTRDYVYSTRNAVTWQMASIAVAFPIFLLAMRSILAEAQHDPERLQSGVRKWLTYIALLVTASAVICDLIWFFDYFLTGELTARFILKAFTVMLICGAIFSYYLDSLHWDRTTKVSRAKSRSLKFGTAAAAVLIAAFSIGMTLAGTPSKQRHIEADSKRIEDLRQTASAIHFWHVRATSNLSSGALPPTLSALVGRGVTASQVIDPEAKSPYEYHIKSGTAYELCATFSAPEEADQSIRTQSWHHGKGRTCFMLDASEQPVW